MITYADLVRALDSTGVLFKPYEWETEPGPETASWGTVRIGGSRVLMGDDGPAEECLTGTISMCTRALDSAPFNGVTEVLRQLTESEPAFSFRMTTVNYNQSERKIYYNWTWSGAMLIGFE